MSGRKCSEFRLQREREEKLRMLQSLGNLHAEVTGLKARIRTLLEGMSEGLRTTFAADMHQAQHWLAQVAPPDIQALGMDTDVARLQTTQATLEQVASQGRQMQERLTVTLTQRADDMGQHLAKRFAEVEQRYIGRQQLLALWYGEEHSQRWERTLHEAQHMLGEEHYAALARLLEDTALEMETQIQWAEGQEAKQQKRLYLLKALRQVCTEMGFDGTHQPRYEREGDRGSRILFTVDMLDRGRIAFTLSLDDISSFSEITQDHCFEEFGELSQYLEEAFGIHTQFRLADGEPVPELLRKGELDLPADAGRQAQA